VRVVRLFISIVTCSRIIESCNVMIICIDDGDKDSVSKSRSDAVDSSLDMIREPRLPCLARGRLGVVRSKWANLVKAKGPPPT